MFHNICCFYFGSCCSHEHGSLTMYSYYSNASSGMLVVPLTGQGQDMMKK